MLKQESISPAIKVGGRGRHANFDLDDECPIEQLERQMKNYLDETAGFFLGAEVSVDVGHRMANAEEIERIRVVLEQEYLLQVSEWRTTHEAMEEGLTGYLGARAVILPPETAPSRERTLVLRGNCHSGSDLHHDGDIVVLGDVNPGAQVTASGDVVVFGALKGVAAAGSRGDEGAVIAALSLRASQIRISRRTAVELGRKKSRRGEEPQMARLINGQIVVEPFDAAAWKFKGMKLQGNGG